MTEYGNNPPPSTAGGGQQTSRFAVNTRFVMSPPGWLKIGQAVVDLITFICATSVWWFVHAYGGGWVQFVSLTAFIITVLQIVAYLFFLIQKIPPKVPIILVEMIYYAVVFGLYFIAMIVSAVKAAYAAGIGASTFFCVVAMVLYGLDAVMTYLAWRRGETTSAGAVGTDTTAQGATPQSNIGTTDITPGVYAGSDLRNPDPVY